MFRGPINALLLALCMALGIALVTITISPLQQSKPNDYGHPAKAKGEHGVTGGAVTNTVAQKQPSGGKQEGNWYQTFLDHTPDWFVAIFTLLLAYITYRLVKTTGDLRASTDRLWQAGERQLITTRSVAAVQARNNRRQLKLAEDTAERQLRAYVSVWDANIIETNSEWSPNVTIKIKNSGQTPAYKVWHRCNWYVSLTGPSDLSLFTKKETHYSDLGPGQDRAAVLIIPIARWDEHKPIIISGHAVLYVFGEVIYLDTFGAPHFTRYRFQMAVDDKGITDGGLLFTKDGNESN